MSKLTNFMIWLVFWCNQTCISRIYANLEVYLFSIDQNENSENMFYPEDKSTVDDFELWPLSNKSYGDLVMSQIASEGKTVPLWKSIDEHLKDVDLFVTAVENVVPYLHHWFDVEVKSGASGVLMRYDGISSRSADIRQLMYTWDTEQGRVVPIPKFVYRIIQAHCSYTHDIQRGLEDHNEYHIAVIVIHNDPTIGSDDDRFDCESCSGWDAVEKTYTEAGLTYVCRLTEKMAKILGIDDYDPESPPLNLDSMDYTSSENWAWTSLTCPRVAGDQRQKIYEEYLKLKGSD